MASSGPSACWSSYCAACGVDAELAVFVQLRAYLDSKIRPYCVMSVSVPLSVQLFAHSIHVGICRGNPHFVDARRLSLCRLLPSTNIAPSITDQQHSEWRRPFVRPTAQAGQTECRGNSEIPGATCTLNIDTLLGSNCPSLPDNIGLTCNQTTHSIQVGVSTDSKIKSRSSGSHIYCT